MTRYRFSDFEFDSVSGRLQKDGLVHRLRPKSARMLSLLIVNRDRTVGREEILKELWSGSTVSFDNGIEACVRDVRKALGDNAPDPSFIKTHPRQGYQFIAQVEESAGDATVPAAARRHAVMTWTAAILMLAVLLTFLGHSAWFGAVFGRPGHASAGGASPPMIAVLPSLRAVPPSGDGEAALMRDAVIGELARYAPQLIRVLSAESSHRLVHNSSFEVDQLAALGVTHVLWMSADESADGAFRVELAEVADGSAILSRRVLRGEANAQKFSLEVARTLASTRETEVTEATGTNDYYRSAAINLTHEARRAYYRGRRAYFRGDVANAIMHFEGAMDIAPESSRLHSAYAYALMHGRNHGAADKARRAAEKALELDAANAEALVVLGNLSVSAGALEEARAYFDSARELAPGLAQLSHGLAALHVLNNDFERALAEIQLAEKLDPLSAPVIGDSAWFFLLAGRIDESLERCAKLAQILGAHIRVISCKFNAYIEKKAYKEAATQIPALMKFQGANEIDIRSVTGRNPDAALKAYWAWRLGALGNQSGWSTDTFAIAGRLYAHLGQQEEAIESFEKAVRGGSRTAPFLLKLKSLNSVQRKIALPD